MADADVDGAHIRTLLLTLIHRTMRPMLEAGRVFAAVPPLHRIEVVTGGGKKNEYRLHLLRRRAATPARPSSSARASGSSSRRSATRVSARWTPTSWPRRRWTRGTGRCAGSPSGEAEEVEAVFELLMGNDVAPRRDFIVDGAQALDRDRIDA